MTPNVGFNCCPQVLGNLDIVMGSTASFEAYWRKLVGCADGLLLLWPGAPARTLGPSWGTPSWAMGSSLSLVVRDGASGRGLRGNTSKIGCWLYTTTSTGPLLP